MKVIINSKEGFNQFYHYYNGGKYLPKKYPKSYPCICKKEEHDGGLGGCSVAHYVVYIPYLLDTLEAFLAGLDAEWEYLC